MNQLDPLDIPTPIYRS
jgi:hypothetical protein